MCIFVMWNLQLSAQMYVLIVMWNLLLSSQLSQCMCVFVMHSQMLLDWLQTYVGCFLKWPSSFFMDNEHLQYKILTWNVRGLNNGARQEDVKQVIGICKPDLVCLQETKMEAITNTIVRSSLGHEYQDNFVYLPAVGSSGGVIIAANFVVMSLSIPCLTNHSITASVHDLRTNIAWIFTGVYGPQGVLEKKMFLRELKHIK
jgi:hypothetical protein